MNSVKKPTPETLEVKSRELSSISIWLKYDQSPSLYLIEFFKLIKHIQQIKNTHSYIGSNPIFSAIIGKIAKRIRQMIYVL